ncbi:shieldin complex subunit 2 [Engraulis encrasicolus]|uniref:shieldin complex subunit 2 n=1 Tax=Engraulis encrasicolus TaxID=184585 RepID=UPI002FD5A375
MTDKPKIHVFLGAPCPSLVALDVAADTDADADVLEVSRDCKTVALSWDQGRLRPKTDHRGVQVNPDSVEANVPAGQVDGVDVDVDARHSPHPEPGTFAEHSASVFEEDGGNKLISPRSSSTPSDLCAQKEPLQTEKPLSQDYNDNDNDDVHDDADDDDELCPESLQLYLDRCFALGQPQTTSDAQHCSVSLETEYLSVWTKSQALLIKRTTGLPQEPSLPVAGGSPHTPTQTQLTPVISRPSPELYSPRSSPGGQSLGGTLQGSLDVFSELLSPRRQQEGGVMLQRTADGLLCTQGSPVVGHASRQSSQRLVRPSSPSSSSPNQDAAQTPPGQSAHSSPVSPARKKRKLSPSATTTPDRQAAEPRAWGGCVPAGPSTLLARCRAPGVQYSILVAVVHPSHLQEIRMKTGAAAGSSVPLATLVVTDQSDVEMKLVMWRTAAFWVLTVRPGDVLLMTGVKVHEDKWRGETVLQSTYSSRLLNLGPVISNLSPSVPKAVNRRTLGELCAHLRERRPLLLSTPHGGHRDLSTVPYANLQALRPDTLVHAVLRVTHTNMVTAWRDGAQGMSRAAGVQRCVLTVEQADGHQGAVVLWGAALAWLERIDKQKEALWHFRMLLVRQDMTSRLLELHSTPWGSCEPLPPGDSRRAEFLKPSQTKSKTSTSCVEIDLRTLLSQKYTGDVELRAQITGFQFQGSPSQQHAWRVMDSTFSPERILEVVSGDVTFTGCGRCAVELDTDDNGIYRPCYPCLPHTTVKQYYRPVVLTVKEGELQVCVQVPPPLVQKVLLNTPPDKLSKSVAPSSDVRLGRVVADRIHWLLSSPRSSLLLMLRSHIQCDENSIPIIQDFLLLDLREAKT